MHISQRNFLEISSLIVELCNENILARVINFSMMDILLSSQFFQVVKVIVFLKGLLQSRMVENDLHATIM